MMASKIRRTTPSCQSDRHCRANLLQSFSALHGYDAPSYRKVAQCAKLILASILYAMAQSTASAEVVEKNKGDLALAAILPPRIGEKTCFTRTYDVTHLRQHPEQQITAMAFELRYVQVPSTTLKRYVFGMSAKLRSRADTLYTSGFCETNINGPFPGGNLCVVACDGGGVSIQKVPDAEALYVYLQTPALGIRMGSSCDEQNGQVTAGVMLEPGTDDKIFRLGSAQAAACRPLEEAVKLNGAH